MIFSIRLMGLGTPFRKDARVITAGHWSYGGRSCVYVRLLWVMAQLSWPNRRPFPEPQA